MFAEAWQALLCLAILLLANILTLGAAFHHASSTKNGLSTAGWCLLLLGNVLPLGFVFYTAAKASRTDEGVVLALLFCVAFLCRCGHELSKLGPRDA